VRTIKMVNCFGLIVPIEFDEEMGALDLLHGEYIEAEKYIKINPKSDDEELVKTIIHECGHALMDRTGLGQVVGEEVEEIWTENNAIFMWENFIIKPR